MTETFSGTITLAGRTYPVRVERRNGRVIRYIGDETVEAFVERLGLTSQTEALNDLAVIGRNALAGSQFKPQDTAWARHRARERAN